MRPEDRQSVILCIDENVNCEDTRDHGARDDPERSELAQPCGGDRRDATLRLRRRATLGEPRETPAVKSGEDDLNDACDGIWIFLQGGLRELGVGQDLGIVVGDGGEVR